jgi:hypothetical protein
MIRWNRRMDPRFTQLADKLAVRPYVAGKIGEQHLPALLWAGASPRRTPFDRLPTPYVIKANHGSGYVIPAVDAPDREVVIRRTSWWLEANYYWKAREYQYFDIPPRLLIEEYLSNPDGSSVNTYKFWCFGGVPHVVHVTDRPDSINPAFDMSWNQIEFSHNPKSQPRHPRPKHLERMVEVASRLSEDFDFVRVDLFNVDGRILFNELTFTPCGGHLEFKPAEWDVKFGDLWSLRD